MTPRPARRCRHCPPTSTTTPRWRRTARRSAPTRAGQLPGPRRRGRPHRADAARRRRGPRRPGRPAVDASAGIRRLLPRRHQGRCDLVRPQPALLRAGDRVCARRRRAAAGAVDQGNRGRRLADDLRQAARDAGQAHAVHVLPARCSRSTTQLDAAGAGVDPAAVADRAAAVGTQDVAILVYTSGSTGRPKGALLRHSGLVRLGRVQTAAYRVDQATTIGDGPINHSECPGTSWRWWRSPAARCACTGRLFDAGATLGRSSATGST